MPSYFSNSIKLCRYTAMKVSSPLFIFITTAIQISISNAYGLKGRTRGFSLSLRRTQYGLIYSQDSNMVHHRSAGFSCSILLLGTLLKPGGLTPKPGRQQLQAAASTARGGGEAAAAHPRRRRPSLSTGLHPSMDPAHQPCPGMGEILTQALLLKKMRRTGKRTALLKVSLKTTVKLHMNQLIYLKTWDMESATREPCGSRSSIKLTVLAQNLVSQHPALKTFTVVTGKEDDNGAWKHCDIPDIPELNCSAVHVHSEAVHQLKKQLSLKDVLDSCHYLNLMRAQFPQQKIPWEKKKSSISVLWQW